MDDERRRRAHIALVVEPAEMLGTDDVDVADLDSVRPEIGASALHSGLLLVGDEDRAARLENRFEAACIDIAELLCEDAGVEMPSTNAEKFAALGERDILSSETAERMRETAGFRNVLAHNYGTDIDDSLVYRTLQNDLEWFPAFLRDVREYLDGH